MASIIQKSLGSKTLTSIASSRSNLTTKILQNTTTKTKLFPSVFINSRNHQTSTNTNPRDIDIHFTIPTGEKVSVKAAEGESILELAHRYAESSGIELEGACEGVCACSTCHVILEDKIYDLESLEEPSEDEEDMLDMAFGLTTTSRLGCQVKITKEMQDAVFKLPSATRNFYVDGHVPKPH